MKICYIDLNDTFSEKYQKNPDSYGGGAIIGRAFINRFDNFYVYANQGSFEGMDKEKINQCGVLSLDSIQKIRNGDVLENHIKELDNYDIIFSHHGGIYLNTIKERKKIAWTLGWQEDVSPLYKDICVFSQHQYPKLYTNTHRFHKIVIGPNVQDFQEYPKDDFIFQCSRHNKIYESITMAKLCLKYGVKIFFAGPVEEGYPLLEYIDNKNTFYLGIITLDEKNKYLKSAKISSQLQNYLGLISLFAKESLAFGTGVLCFGYGEWNRLKNGNNAFFINNESDFVNAWNNRNNISQYDCWLEAKEHSEDKMIESINSAFDKVLGK